MTPPADFFQLRDHQERAFGATREAFRRHRRVVVQLPTGAGKTRLAVSMMHAAMERGKRSLFICDRVELIDQTSEALDAFDMDHGVIQADHWRIRPHLPIQVASPQTLARRSWPEVDFVIVDENHTQYQSTIKQMQAWNKIPWLGLSATPFARGMGLHWEHLVVGATTSELIQAGVLVPYKAYGPTPPDLSGIHMKGEDYDQKELGEAVTKKRIVGDIVKTWKELGENRQTLCFAVNIAHAKAIAAAFNSSGIPAAHLDHWLSKAERKDTIESLRTGRLKVLVSVDILTKGFDYPAASCAILARPTKSLTVHIQQCGRVLRTAEGKQDAIILDHGGNFSNLQMLDDPLPDYLDDGKKSWHEKRKEKEDEPLPKPCPACGYIKPPKVHVCPSCGFAPERKRHGVETVDGRLAEIKRSKKKASMEDKQDVYAMLLWIARNRGRKKGWIGHTYRKMFGVWPTRMDGVRATPPSAEVEQFVRDVNAQYRKSISKHAPQERQPTTGW